MTKPPYSRLYVPRNHPGTAKGVDYEPRRTNDEVEAARRRANPAGSLIHEQQSRGSKVGRRTLQLLTDRRDISIAAPLIGEAFYNAGAYVLRSRTNKVSTSRSEADLYPAVNPETDFRRSGATIRADGLLRAGAVQQAVDLVLAEHVSGRPTNRTKYQAGRALASAGLLIGLAADGEIANTGTPFDVQERVRESGLVVMTGASEARRELTVPPSLGQLDDDLSPLSLHLRTKTTGRIEEAYLQAYAETRAEVA